MKKLILSVMFLLCLSLVSATDLTACGEITSLGEYILLNDVNSEGRCFNIVSDDVVLDCNGYQIIYAELNDGGQGILVDHAENVEIRNCNIITHATYAGAAMNFFHSPNGYVHHNVIDNTATYGAPYGTYAMHSPNMIIDSNTYNNNDNAGVWINEGSNNARITNNVVRPIHSTGVKGIKISTDSDELLISGNDIITGGHGGHGVVLDRSPSDAEMRNSVVENNVIVVNGDAGGISLDTGVIDSIVRNNGITVNHIDGNGVALWSGNNRNNLVSNNIVSGEGTLFRNTIVDGSDSFVEYFNEHGKVKWKLDNFNTTRISLDDFTLENNLVGTNLVGNYENEIVGYDNIMIEMYNLPFDEITTILKDGVECIDCSDMVYTSGSLTFTANTMGVFMVEGTEGERGPDPKKMELEQKIAAKEERLNTLLENKNKVKETRALLIDKKKTVKTSRATLIHKRNTQKDIRANLIDRRNIQKSKGNIANVKALNIKITAKTNLIKNLNAKITTKTDILKDLNYRITNKTEKLGIINKSISTVKKQINRLKAELAELTSS